MNTDFKGTIGIYIRVSSREQAEEGYSIAAQRDRLKAYCKAQGWTDYKIYVDEGVSAKNLKRPELQTMLKHVREDKIKLVLVYRLDRFTRRVRDLHKLLEILGKNDCSFRSATEVYDTTSAMGRLFITIVAALAEWESDNSSERVKMALLEKVSGGERVGAVPYPFDLTEEETLIANPERAAVTLDMIKKYKGGMSVTAIANHLTITNTDKPHWHAKAIFRIFKNPALYGATRWVDDIFEDTHQGLISKKEFDYLQELMEDRSVNLRRDLPTTHLFQGIMVCPQCGKRMSVNRYLRTQPDGTEIQRAIYRCLACFKDGRAQNTPGEGVILKSLYDYMENVVVEQGEEKLDKKNDAIHADLIKEFNHIEKIRAKYQRGWATDQITDEEFSGLMAETLSVYNRVKKELEDYKEFLPVDMGQVQDSILLFNANFKDLNLEEKRAFVAEFIKAIHFKMIPQPPKSPRYKTGTPLLEVTDVEFR